MEREEFVSTEQQKTNIKSLISCLKTFHLGWPWRGKVIYRNPGSAMNKTLYRIASSGQQKSDYGIVYDYTAYQEQLKDLTFSYTLKDQDHNRCNNRLLFSNNSLFAVNVQLVLLIVSSSVKFLQIKSSYYLFLFSFSLLLPKKKHKWLQEIKPLVFNRTNKF